MRLLTAMHNKKENPNSLEESALLQVDNKDMLLFLQLIQKCKIYYH